MSLDIFKTLFTNIWSIFLVIFFFGGSIFVHELGHFLAARRRGLKIERFSIGFGPKIFGWKKNGIDYRISLLPLGGYVALPQMADLRAIEGSSSNQKQLPPISYTDKVIVSVMGAVFNLIFAFLLATILWTIGQPANPIERSTIVGYVDKQINIDGENIAPGPAFEAGILPGDKILKIDDHEVNSFSNIRKYIVMGTGRNSSGQPESIFTIQRNSNIFDITVNPALVQTNPLSGDYMRAVSMTPSMTPMMIDQVMENSPAQKSGIKPGDELIAINGEKIYSLLALSDLISEDQNRSVTLNLKRNNEIISIELKPAIVPYTKARAQIEYTNTETNQVKQIDIIPEGHRPFDSALSNPSEKADLVVLSTIDAFPRIGRGDKVIKVNDQPVDSLSSFTTAFEKEYESHQKVKLTLSAHDDEYDIVMTGSLNATLLPPKTQPMIGIELATKETLIHVTPVDQFRENILMTFQTLKSLLSPTSDIHVQHMMGPPGIVKTLHTFTTTNIRLVLWFVIVLNINLAILNLLPVPVLDGGHIMFATIGKLRGKELPAKFIAASQSLFMICLFSLMLYVSFFDVRRWQGDNKMENDFTKTRSIIIERVFPE